MSSQRMDVVVIGGGVVGLACAAELAQRGRSVIVLERHDRVGHETSSRNSGVVHAGIYYPTGSLKAKTCVEGRELLYERCVRLGIDHRRIGKLIVAVSDEECARLEQIAERARTNGAGAIELLDAAGARALEALVACKGALWSPDTGIVDAHGLVQSYAAGLEARGGSIALRTRVVGLVPRSYGWQVETEAPDASRFRVDCAAIVNAAGLDADRIASMCGLDPDALGWRLHPCKGDYFSVAPSAGPLVSHLVYPVPPADGSLGIHLTLDLGGRLRVGPDATYVEHRDYHVDPDKAEVFARAVRRYLPVVETQVLAPEMAGIRPRLQGPGEGFRDFVLAESSEHGAPGALHLVGIESPGLTAAGALARRAAELLSGGPGR